jgi:phage RecT family recombinase
MANKVVAKPQAREKAAVAIRDAKRKFNAQNTHKLLDYNNEARFALQAISNNDKLLECDPETIKDAFVNLAAMGLSLNPAGQQAALLPRWNSKRSRVECTASPQYRGLMKLATDTGVISNIRADVVFLCEEDTFDVDLGSNPYLKHKPKLFAPREERVIDLVSGERNRMIGAYCIAQLRDAPHPHITVMDIGEILTVARASDAFNPRDAKKNPSGPWVVWPGEMTKKSAIKRGYKQWPVSDGEAYKRLQTAIHIDNEAEANEQASEIDEESLRADMGEKISDEQAKIIRDLCSTQGLAPAKVAETYRTNSLKKIPVRYFAEIEAKLLDRQKKVNEAAKQNAEGGDPQEGEKESAKPAAKEPRGKTASKSKKG